MLCPKCKQTLPEGSTFCQYCGININEWNNICPSCGKELPKDSAFCQYCGIQINAVKNNHPDISKKTKLSKKVIIPWILSGTLLVSSIGLLIWGSSEKTKADELDEKVVNLLAATKTGSKITDKYKKLESALSFEDYGYSSESFKVNRGIIVLDKNEDRKEIILTANFNTYVEISTSYSGMSANVEFSEDTWYGTTTKLYVERAEGYDTMGITTVTFSNNYDSQTFDVLIIVF